MSGLLIWGKLLQNFFSITAVFDATNFDYIAFSDQDDIWLPNHLSMSIHEINERNVDACSSSVIAFGLIQVLHSTFLSLVTSLILILILNRQVLVLLM